MDRLIQFGATALLLSSVVNVNATLVTFNEQSVYNPASKSLIDSGFIFSSSNQWIIPVPDQCGFGGCASNGSPYLDSIWTSITMTSETGGLFDIYSFDAAELFVNSPSSGDNYNATAIDLLGTFPGGSTIFASLSLDGFNDGSGGGADFETLFPLGFTGLTSVVFTGRAASGGFGDFGIDNISTSADDPHPPHYVAIPAAAWLFISGLLGLIGIANRNA